MRVLADPPRRFPVAGAVGACDGDPGSVGFAER